MNHPRFQPWGNKIKTYRFSFVPHGKFTQVLFWTRRQPELECEAEDGVDVVQELQAREDLGLDVIWGAEDVGVVLLEAPDAGQPRQGAGQLVAVEHAEVRHAEGQLAPGPVPVVENETATRIRTGCQQY